MKKVMGIVVMFALVVVTGNVKAEGENEDCACTSKVTSSRTSAANVNKTDKTGDKQEDKSKAGEI